LWGFGGSVRLKTRKEEKTTEGKGPGARKGACEMIGMKKKGGEAVGRGNYWNFATGERVHIEDSGVLPGDESQTWYKGNPVMILLAGPVLGLAYAVFLPFIGIAMAASLIGRRIFGGAADRVQKGATFSWKPSEAYLAGKKGRAKKAEEGRSEEKKE